ncbi:hypothetical protein [Staphylococcus pseudoxylosus]|uniref:hypothetical protein n=1 Tax=Staphylococcus pseudoxylosus TaxID=2282419 RepID=UPI002DBAA447|nr:hypothetical protein [Staphylococcus pseudoxylosus]MEB6038012.1 hypothetical protein [Staphylococcus pseudoxylosus]
MASKHGKKITPKIRQRIANKGIAYNTFLNRLNNGWDIEKAIETPVKKKQYLTKEEKDILVKNEIPVTTYNNRRSNGWSKEKALSTPVRKQEKLDETLHEKLKKSGVSVSLYEKRKENGWSEEKAINQKKPNIKLTSDIAKELSRKKISLSEFYHLIETGSKLEDILN